MKRILIFVLLGPLIGFVVFVLWQLSLGRSIGGVEGLLLGLPFAFIFGALPSVVVGFEDRFLEDKISRLPRAVITAVVGYCASIAMMAVWTAVPIPLPQLLTFGMVGAVQGGMCSWLADDTHAAGDKSTNHRAG